MSANSFPICSALLLLLSFPFTTLSFLRVSLCCVSPPVCLIFFLNILFIEMPIILIHSVWSLECRLCSRAPGCGFLYFFLSLYLFYPGAGKFFKIKLMPRLDTSQKGKKMWVKICNLNHIPEIGGTESCSCRRRQRF